MDDSRLVDGSRFVQMRMLPGSAGGKAKVDSATGRGSKSWSLVQWICEGT